MLPATMPVSQEKAFDSYRDYRSATREVIGLVDRELLIFDENLRELRLETTDALEILQRVLSAVPRATLRILLHDTAHFESACPRLFGLYARYRHVMEVRRTAENLRHLSEPFVVADGSHLVVRFHCDHARGKVVLSSPEEVSAWRKRFGDMWEESSESVPANRLGL